MNGIMSTVETKIWKEWQAEGFPELLRGDLVSVVRPWSWRYPWKSSLAWAIRKVSQRFTGQPAEIVHSMIYVGGGKVWSQGLSFNLVSLKQYQDCILIFQRNLKWGAPTRNKLSAEACVFKGQGYGYRDLLAFALAAFLGYRDPVPVLLDKCCWVCSEAVVELIRRIKSSFLGNSHSLVTPQEVHDWAEESSDWLCVLEVKLCRP